jgi:hypothetical protein
MLYSQKIRKKLIFSFPTVADNDKIPLNIKKLDEYKFHGKTVFLGVNFDPEEGFDGEKKLTPKKNL